MSSQNRRPEMRPKQSMQPVPNSLFQAVPGTVLAANRLASTDLVQRFLGVASRRAVGPQESVRFPKRPGRERRVAIRCAAYKVPTRV